MATSKFLRTFRNIDGTPITTAAIWLVPQANTYPTGALALTPHPTRDGQYYRNNVPDGEYKIYIDPAGGSSPTLYEERLWIGENRITTISDHFDPADSYKIKTTGIKDSAITATKLATDAVETEKIKDLNVTNSKIANSTIAAAKMAAQTVTVVSETNPTPSYIGQPGIDGNGNPYVAIALTGKMWRRITRFDEEIYNENYNRNFRWINGLTNSTNFNAYFGSNIPTIEESNSVFNYQGRCARGCTIQTRIYLGVGSRADIKENKIIIKVEIYIPPSTSVTLQAYYNIPTETQIFGTDRNFSTEGVNIYEVEVDLTSISTLTRIGVYAISGSGDLQNVRFGRVYIGANKQGVIDGTNTLVDNRIDNKITTYDSAIKNYILKEGSSQVLKPAVGKNSMVDNEAEILVDRLNEFGFGENVRIVDNPTKELIDFPNDSRFYYQKIIRVAFDTPLTNNSTLLLEYRTKYRPRIKFSIWILMNYNATAITYGGYVKYRKGLNDAIQWQATIGFQSNTYNTIKSTLDGGSPYSGSGTGFVWRIVDYFIENGNTYWNLQFEMTADAPPSDYIAINVGRITYLTTGQTGEVKFFGLQVFENTFLAQNEGKTYFESLGRQAIQKFIEDTKRNASLLFDNKIVNGFNGGGNTFQADGVSKTVYHSNMLFLSKNNVEVSSKVFSDKFHEGYVISHKTLSYIPKYVDHSTRNYFIEFVGNNLEYDGLSKAVIGFWIDRRELKGNGLLYHADNGANYYLRYEDLLALGFVESRVQGTDDPIPYFEVDAIDGNFTHIRFYIKNSYLNGSYIFALSIYNTSSNNVPQITIYNPTLLYTDVIDPYHRYLSYAEKHNPQFIGKKITLIGDSQYNDNICLVEFAEKLGANCIDHHQGGHSMKLNDTNLINTNYYWFYHRNLRDAVIDSNPDIFISTCSTNDGFGGGDLSESAVQDVLDNYPVYGDDPETIILKTALFNAMTPAQRGSIFTFKACYSAYLKQLLENKPETRVILTSVPISCSGLLTGGTDPNGKGIWAGSNNPDTARAAILPGTVTKRADIIELRDKHSTNFADCLNEVGLTFENFTSYCIDGTHWLPEIKYRIAKSIIQEIKKLY